MLKNINKFFNRPQAKMSLLGFLLISGFAMGFLTSRPKPVLSNQLEAKDTYNNLVAELRESKNTSKELVMIPETTALRTESQSSVTNTKFPPEDSFSEENELVAQLRASKNISRESETFVTSTEVTPRANPEQDGLYLDSQSRTRLNTVPKTTAFISVPQAPITSKKGTLGANFPKQDGIYLYGQSPKAGEIGKGYIVFEQRQGRITGALYMPNSEFSCFQGTLENSGELAMSVTASPALGSEDDVATTNLPQRLDENVPVHYAYSVALQDYHSLNTVSETDRNVLQMCQKQ
ncbi:MAG: hypothetical protein KME60_24950 [Cyanomargarita calcarea GSE-NOS-MK-12-04C]|uniref:Uncharacterized protein n=1 Tax=Cyanomargarita calcarea GSE-NOS-MK-12-04C TaxID=2839659 RepID=A0A951QRX6_9CYAN|nr:hypothetical protein [Cyanomargarita calcarea GSE-NOS-MK-12-04C]